MQYRIVATDDNQNCQLQQLLRQQKNINSGNAIWHSGIGNISGLLVLKIHPSKLIDNGELSLYIVKMSSMNKRILGGHPQMEVLYKLLGVFHRQTNSWRSSTNRNFENFHRQKRSSMHRGPIRVYLYIVYLWEVIDRYRNRTSMRR